jgi:large conductance mechanosensitive channel
MGVLSEFKAFAMRGNVVDLAIGVVIGAAFGKIVDVVVGKILMPIIGLATGGIDFSKQTIQIAGAEGDKPAVVLGIGEVVGTIIQFIIVAFFLFLIVKAMNSMKKAEPAPPPPGPTKDQQLLTDILATLQRR